MHIDAVKTDEDRMAIALGRVSKTYFEEIDPVALHAEPL